MSEELALSCYSALLARGETVATAESLTGGLLGGALTAVSGISAVYRGGVISYAVDVKASLLGVPQALLDRYGPVHPDTAAAMATGVRRLLGATYGLSTTGVAGPLPHGGQPAGTVDIACVGPSGPVLRRLRLDGDREQIRARTVSTALDLLRLYLAR